MIPPPPPGPIDKPAAKRALGLASTQTTLLSVGHQNYFRPSATENFFTTAAEILERCPDIALLFVGVSDSCPFVPDAFRSDPRVRLFGPIPDPGLHYRAADICLESFPTPSLGAVAESTIIGAAYPVLAYAERESILHPTRDDHPRAARDARSYVEEVTRLVKNLETTRADAIAYREAMVQRLYHAPANIADVNARLAQLPHRPERIPVAAMNSEADNLLLAANGGIDIGAHFDAAYGSLRAIPAHVHAVRRGFETLPVALRRSAELLVRRARMSAGAMRDAVAARLS